MKTSKNVNKSGGSLSINIPSLWAKAMKLKKGDKVDLEYQEDEKIIIIKKGK